MGRVLELLKVSALLLAVGGDVAWARPKGELWAVLVAGSSSWMNYRHQVSHPPDALGNRLRMFGSVSLAQGRVRERGHFHDYEISTFCAGGRDSVAECRVYISAYIHIPWDK